MNGRLGAADAALMLGISREVLVRMITRLGEHLGLWKQGRADAGRTEVVLAPDGSVHIITAEG